MNSSCTSTKFGLKLVALFLLTVTTTLSLHAGIIFPGDGGLQIVFSDDGMGGTNVTVTGTGQTDDDIDVGYSRLGFGESDEADTLHAPVPAALAALSALAPVTLSDPISITWDSVGTFVYTQFGIDGGHEGAFFETSDGFPDIINSSRITAPDGNGKIPIPYAVFSPVHGMSFPTTDGFTFVFESSADTCADKSQLLRKINKLKKTLTKVKRSGNSTKAKKLTKTLRKLILKYKRSC